MLAITAILDDEGSRWMQVTDGVDVWEEPAREWAHILDLTNGTRCYRANDGRIAKALD